MNLRVRSGKPVGGQAGHRGSTLKFEGNPDKVVYHIPFTTCGCGNEYLETEERVKHEIDLPIIKKQVTAHKQIHYHCTKCGATFSGKGFRGHNVQYGPNIKGMALYLKDYHFIPYRRLSTLYKDCFSLAISEGSFVNFTGKAYQTLGRFENVLKESLQKSPVVHSDETGGRAEGKTHWVHVASNKRLTHYHFDPNRGKAAIEKAGILPNYTGTLIHDRFSPYFKYSCSHGLCNAHILRELVFLEEQGHQWAKAVKTLLLNAKNRSPLTKNYITRTKKEYKKTIRGQLAKQPTNSSNGCRGKPRCSKSHNLLVALNKYNREILAFLANPEIPFDNNLAERDIRMVKTKQKVSGCFRTQKGGMFFARIRSYVSTLNKQNRNVLKGMKHVFSPNPDFHWIAE